MKLKITLSNNMKTKSDTVLFLDPIYVIPKTYSSHSNCNN